MPKDPQDPSKALLKMEDPRKATKVVSIAIVCVIIAFAWLVAEPAKGDQVEPDEELNWCNVAWSGAPDQNRQPGDDRERVRNWKLHMHLYGSRWVFWNSWETDEQRELRIALGGWVTCGTDPDTGEPISITSQPGTDTTGTGQPGTDTSTTELSATDTTTTRQPARDTTTTRQPARTTTGNNFSEAEAAEFCRRGNGAVCHYHHYGSGGGPAHGGSWHFHADSDNDCIGNEHEPGSDPSLSRASGRTACP